MKHFLILEDDRPLCAGICLALSGDTTETVSCHTLADARAALARQRFDLLVVDINLPDGSGLSFVRSLRPGNPVPVLILSANDLELDIVTGLEAGADDYLTKPFSLAVLRARIAALLRRAAGVEATVYVCGPFCFDFARLRFTKCGLPVELSRTEQKLLHFLVSNPGQTLPRATLLDRVWGTAEYVDENALSVTVKRLRDKLEESPSHPRWLCTVYGVGYVWREPS